MVIPSRHLQLSKNAIRSYQSDHKIEREKVYLEHHSLKRKITHVSQKLNY